MGDPSVQYGDRETWTKYKWGQLRAGLVPVGTPTIRAQERAAAKKVTAFERGQKTGLKDAGDL